MAIESKRPRKRVMTTLDDLEPVWDEIQRRTGLSDSELLRQGLVRLALDVKRDGGLMVLSAAAVMEEPVPG